MAQTGKWVVKNAKMGVWRFQDNRCELFYNYSFGPLPWVWPEAELLQEDYTWTEQRQRKKQCFGKWEGSIERGVLEIEEDSAAASDLHPGHNFTPPSYNPALLHPHSPALFAHQWLNITWKQSSNVVLQNADVYCIQCLSNHSEIHRRIMLMIKSHQKMQQIIYKKWSLLSSESICIDFITWQWLCGLDMLLILKIICVFLAEDLTGCTLIKPLMMLS